ncbi:hypothetical protein ACFLZR_01790, partial [Candidatus Neomarinimicrobiota bacterium]
DWLRENIHRLGRSWTAVELIEDLSGQPLSEKPFVCYLNRKYGEIYSI